MDITEYRKQVEDDREKIWENFKELKESILDYKKMVNKSLYGEVFEKLALLMADMESHGDKFSERLKEILIDFGIEEVSPQKGEIIDYHFHDRANINDEGMTITECVCKGWKYDNVKLLSAIVRTSETIEITTDEQTKGDTDDEQ